MNKVSLRCAKDGCAKFYYASKRMFFESKTIKVFLYIIAIIPIVLTFIPNFGEMYTFICSLVSFGLTLVNQVSTSFLNNHKEKAILEHQIYESEITGSTFSKIEYDREATNEVNELAIRKGLPKMRKTDEYPVIHVPQEITDDYSYIYLCRKSAATDRYLLSRIFYIYFMFLMAIVALFVAATIYEESTTAYLTLLIGFYPLVSPIITDCLACKKCMRQCAKICADIDNFFADGDASIERLARFYYYVQNIEFEMLLNRPAIFNIFPRIFRKGIDVLQDGVTVRFIEAIQELKGRSLMLKGAIAQPHGKGLITKVEYDLEYLEKKEKQKRKKAQAKLVEEPETVKKELTSDNTSKSAPEAKVSTSKVVTKPVASRSTTKTTTATTSKATTTLKTVKPKETKPSTSKVATDPAAPKTVSSTKTTKKEVAPKTATPKSTSSKTTAKAKTTSTKKVNTN